MRIIKSNDNELLMKEYSLVLDPTSDYALIEKGFEPEVGLINIVFDDVKGIKDMLNTSNYYKSKNHLIGKKEDEQFLVQVEDIIYIEGINNDTYVYTTDDVYMVKDKLYELENTLFDKKFVRVSKSFIVSINYIDRIKPTFNGKLVLKLMNGQSLEVSRHYLKSFRKYLGF